MLTKIVGNKLSNNNVLPKSHYPTGNTAAVITIAAVADQRIIIDSIQWSYSGAPTGGRLSITDGGVTIFDIDITAAGPGGFGLTLPASGGLKSPAAGSAIVITLAAGGAGVTGKLNAQVSIEPE